MTLEASLQGDQRFKLDDAASYDPVAHSFESLSDRYTAPIARRLANLVHEPKPTRVLDLATGTGIVALELAARGHRVVGIDLARAMLARGRSRHGDSGAGSQLFELLPMDAEKLAFADGAFDTVVSLYGLLHFPDPLSALLEARRVLRPTGRLVVAVGSGPSRRTVEGLLDAGSRLWGRCLGLAGRRLEAPRFLDGLVRQWLPATAEPEEALLPRTHRNRAQVVPALLRRAGFVDVQTCWWSEVTEVATAAEFWELQATFSSFARKRLAVATEDEIGALRDRFDRACSRVLDRGGTLLYPRGALVATGRRGGESRHSTVTNSTSRDPRGPRT